MNCETYGVLLSKYVDDELSIEERKAIDEHLGRCNSCRETLAIFLKNESILERALSGEIFGSMVVNRVMSSVRKEPAAPVSAGSPAASAAIPFPKSASLTAWRIVASVAALLLLAVTITSAYTIMNLQNTVAAISDDYRDTRVKQDNAIRQYKDILEMTAANLENVREREAMNLVKSYAKNTDTPGLASYNEKGGIFLLKNKSEFKNPDKIHHYEIIRYKEGDRQPVKLNKDPLTTPEFRDRTAAPGQKYTYNFIACDVNDHVVDHIAMQEMMTEGGVDLKEVVKLKYLASSSVNEIVTIEVTRTIDGATRSERFMTEVNELIGNVRYSADLQKEIDFTTSCRIKEISTAEKTRTIIDEVVVKNSEGTPMYDINGHKKVAYEARAISAGEEGRKITVVNEKTGATFEIWEGETKTVQ